MPKTAKPWGKHRRAELDAYLDREWPRLAPRARAKELTLRQCADRLGMGLSTLHRYLQDTREESPRNTRTQRARDTMPAQKTPIPVTVAPVRASKRRKGFIPQNAKRLAVTGGEPLPKPRYVRTWAEFSEAEREAFTAAFRARWPRLIEESRRW